MKFGLPLLGQLMAEAVFKVAQIRWKCSDTIKSGREPIAQSARKKTAGASALRFPREGKGPDAGPRISAADRCK